MFAPKLAPETVNVAVVDAELAQEVNADKLVADSVINGVVHASTVTADEAALTVLQLAVALAVMVAPPANAVKPDFVHAPDDTVVVPSDVEPLNNSTTVPLASVLVPDIVVASQAIGEDTVGVAV